MCNIGYIAKYRRAYRYLFYVGEFALQGNELVVFYRVDAIATAGVISQRTYDIFDW